MWWLAASYEHAFWWAAAAHSIQYLLVAAIEYARTRTRQANAALGRLHTPLFHAAWFYAMAFVLAGGLFFALPVMTFVPLGFDSASSVFMMAMVINLHHFVVDGFIWKQRKPAATAPLGRAATA